MIKTPIETSVRNAFRLLVGATCLLFLITILLGLYTLRLADRNTTVFCAQRDALDTQIESSVEFLKANPQGIPGISASVIKRGLKNSRRTRKTLNVLDCG
jgi:hypothetical protein